MSKYMITAANGALPVRAPRIFPVHEGKGIVVTGGSGGIGAAIVGQLVAEGARVVVADLKLDAAEATADALGGAAKGCFAVAMDVGSETSVADGIAAGQLGAGGVVCDRLHLQDVEAAEVGDLLEAERGIVDQPGGGRMGHERLGHGKTPSETNRAAPYRSGHLTPADLVRRAP